MTDKEIHSGTCLSDGYKVFKEEKEGIINYRRVYFPVRCTLDDLLLVTESFSGEISKIMYDYATMGIYCATHDDEY